MYSAYFINTLTGELKHTSQPKDNPSGVWWNQITWEQWNLYTLVANYYCGKQDSDNDTK